MQKNLTLVRSRWRLFFLALLLFISTAHAEDSIPDFISLGGQAGIPPFLKADPQTVADADGLHVNQLQTVATDFSQHDFTLDILYSFSDKDRDIFAGIGENERDRNRIANWLGLHFLL